MIAICAEFKMRTVDEAADVSYQSFIIVAQFVEIIKLVFLIGFKVLSRAWLMDRPGLGGVVHAILSASCFFVQTDSNYVNVKWIFLTSGGLYR